MKRNDVLLRLALGSATTVMLALGFSSAAITAATSRRPADVTSIDRELGIAGHKIDAQQTQLERLEQNQIAAHEQLDKRMKSVEAQSQQSADKIELFTSAVEKLVGSVLVGLVVMVLRAIYSKRQMEDHRRNIRHDVRNEFAAILKQIEANEKLKCHLPEPEQVSSSLSDALKRIGDGTPEVDG